MRHGDETGTLESPNKKKGDFGALEAMGKWEQRAIRAEIGNA